MVWQDHDHQGQDCLENTGISALRLASLLADVEVGCDGDNAKNVPKSIKTSRRGYNRIVKVRLPVDCHLEAKASRQLEHVRQDR